VGERVNYGAGSITANYDGANKHRTVIECRRAHRQQLRAGGAGAMGAGATVGGGSTITKNVPAGALSVARGRQVNITGWKRPAKQPKP
jgi:bifunctional UDP-N-acetylglucosamine pyrophosphorylase/glucosamine-1-phosphate N-acetyltransferase